jgi:hypothetical protein
MKTADFPSVKEARRCAAKQLALYRQMMNSPENVMHTPGPWVVVEHSWSRTGIFANHICVASLDISDEADDETQAEWAAAMDANAQLISAAPDLLRACEVALAALLERPGYQGSTPDMLRAAIAKAQG